MQVCLCVLHNLPSFLACLLAFFLSFLLSFFLSCSLSFHTSPFLPSFLPSVRPSFLPSFPPSFLPSFSFSSPLWLFFDHYLFFCSSLSRFQTSGDISWHLKPSLLGASLERSTELGMVHSSTEQEYMVVSSCNMFFLIFFVIYCMYLNTPFIT